MNGKRYILMLVLFLFAFGLTGITAASPDENEKKPVPEGTAAPVSEGQRFSENGTVWQTMYFTRCGHSVSRRTEAAEDVRGAGFDEVRAYYDVWTVTEISENKAEMERKIDLYCPMHKVVCLNEAGQAVMAENRFGDGMAIVRIYEGAKLTEKVKNELLAGKGFDSETEAEAYLMQAGILQ